MRGYTGIFYSKHTEIDRTKSNVPREIIQGAGRGLAIPVLNGISMGLRGNNNAVLLLTFCWGRNQYIFEVFLFSFLPPVPRRK